VEYDQVMPILLCLLRIMTKIILFYYEVFLSLLHCLVAGGVSAPVFTRNSDRDQDHDTKPKLSCYEYSTGRGRPI
jgi:hypothetical protein